MGHRDGRARPLHRRHPGLRGSTLRNNEEREIGGRRVLVAQLPASRALKLLRRLGHVLGPALAKAAGASKGTLSIAALDVGSLSDAITVLFDRLTEPELDHLMRELLSTAQVMVDGKWVQLSAGSGPQPYDVTFAGDLAGLFATLGFAIEVNFGDFFAVARGALQAHRAGSPSAGSSTSTSAGPSGESSSRS